MHVFQAAGLAHAQTHLRVLSHLRHARDECHALLLIPLKRLQHRPRRHGAGCCSGLP